MQNKLVQDKPAEETLPKLPLGKALDELKRECPYLSTVEIQCHSSSEEFTFLLVPRRHRPMLVGAHGKTADALAAKIGRRVRVISGKTEHEIAEEVLYPVKITGLDKIFAEEGETFRVRISQEEGKRLELSQSDAEKVLTKLLSKKTLVQLE